MGLWLVLGVRARVMVRFRLRLGTQPESLDLAVLTITAVLICLEWWCSGECRGSCEIFGSLP